MSAAMTDRELLDRLALQAVMSRYFKGIDRNRHQAGAHLLFTEDVKDTCSDRGTFDGDVFVCPLSGESPRPGTFLSELPPEARDLVRRVG